MATRFGKYSLLYRIAVGGMAEIWIARHTGMQGFSRKIVIKIIRSHLSQEASFVTMFLNEAKLAAQLNHSNIAQIFDLGRIADSYFIAMEYIHGRDMRAVVSQAERKGIPFPLEYTLLMAAEACEGLFYAHRKADDHNEPLNIVHRDVTPENIMVSFDGEVKILDFGIAKAENMATDTRVGEIKGKLGYMSPEQIMGKAVDHRADLFSLGVVLYELASGHKLFSGKTDVDVLRNVVDGSIYPPSYFNKDIPQPVEDLIMRALERNRSNRYQSAWELQFDIRAFLSQHEFNPSAIHLSNFMRQLFADEIRTDELALAKAEAEPDQPDGQSTDTFAIPAPEPAERRKTSSVRRQAQNKDAPPAADPESLIGNGKLSLTVELERGQYQRLFEVAERNGLSVPAFIREILEQYTRFI